MQFDKQTTWSQKRVKGNIQFNTSSCLNLSKTRNNTFRYLENEGVTLVFFEILFVIMKLIEFCILWDSTKIRGPQNCVTSNCHGQRMIALQLDEIVSSHATNTKGIIKVHSFFDNVKESLLNFWISKTWLKYRS